MIKNSYVVLVQFWERRIQNSEHQLDTMVEKQLTIHGSLEAFSHIRSWLADCRLWNKEGYSISIDVKSNINLGNITNMEQQLELS